MTARKFFAVVGLLLIALIARAEEHVRVAVYKDDGGGPEVLLKVLTKFEQLQVTTLSAEDITAGKLKDFAVIIHPGGSGSKQGRKLGEEGRKEVREFVQRGGGYVGYCAGAYLATTQYDWSLHILDAQVIDRAHWARGFGEVKLKLSSAGQKLLAAEEGIDVYYHQGPLLAPHGNPEVPDYDELASFATEIAKNGAPEGIMTGTTAIAAGTFGKGRVLSFSPHPEKTKGLESFVLRSTLWAAGKEAAVSPQDSAAKSE